MRNLNSIFILFIITYKGKKNDNFFLVKCIQNRGDSVYAFLFFALNCMYIFIKN